jgi:hypothetical protein
MFLPRELSDKLRQLWEHHRHGQPGGSALDEREGRRMLREVGLDPAEVASARADSLADQARMLRHAGLDADAMPARFWGALRDAERVCAHCRAAGRCHQWQTATHADAPRLFCPNMPLFDEIRAALQGQGGPAVPADDGEP